MRCCLAGSAAPASRTEDRIQGGAGAHARPPAAAAVRIPHLPAAKSQEQLDQQRIGLRRGEGLQQVCTRAARQASSTGLLCIDQVTKRQVGGSGGGNCQRATRGDNTPTGMPPLTSVTYSPASDMASLR